MSKIQQADRTRTYKHLYYKRSIKLCNIKSTLSN